MFVLCWNMVSWNLHIKLHMTVYIPSSWACVHQLKMSISENWLLILLTDLDLHSRLQGSEKDRNVNMLLPWSTKIAKWFGFDMSDLITKTTWWDSETADVTNTNMKRVALTTVMFQNETGERGGSCWPQLDLKTALGKDFFCGCWQ